ELDVEADREPATFLRAAIRRFHDAGTAPCDDGPPPTREAAPGLPRLLVDGTALADARRAEDRHCRPVDLVDHLEALAKFACDEGDVSFEVLRLLLGGEDPAVFHQKFRGTCVAC